MHDSFKLASQVSHKVIGAAIEVHRAMGPGLLETIYEWCLLQELKMRRLAAVNQETITLRYKRFSREQLLRFDLLVERCVLVEVKAVQEVHPIHKAQLLSYMKLLDVPLGLLINFHEPRLVEGVSRLVLAGAAAEDDAANHHIPSN